MFIRRLQIRDFGKFHNEEIVLRPGFNVIKGSNEAGKTTMKDFILGMFYGIDKARGAAAKNDLYEMRKPMDREGYSGSMELSVDGRNYLVERNFTKHDKRLTVTDMANGGELPVTQKTGLMGTLLETSKEVYCNTLCIGGMTARTGQALTDEIKNSIVNMTVGNNRSVDCVKAIEQLAGQKKQYNVKAIEDKVEVMAARLSEKDEHESQLAELRREYRELEAKKRQLADEKRQTTWEEIASTSDAAAKGAREEEDGESGNWFAVIVSAIIIFFLIAGALVAAAWYLPEALLPFPMDLRWMGCGGILLLVAVILVIIVAFSGSTYTETEAPDGGEANAPDSADGEPDAGSGRDGGAQAEPELPVYDKKLGELNERMVYLKACEEQLLKQQEKKQLLLNQYDELKRELREKTKYRKAIDVAIGVIQQLSSNIYRDSGQELGKEMSKVMSKITKGKYSQVFVDEELDIRVLHEGHYIPLSYLSEGTKEQLYFALRMAAAKQLSYIRMPILLDDMFTTYDKHRLKQVITYLAEEKNEQIVLFTMNDGILHILDEIGKDYNLVSLN